VTTAGDTNYAYDRAGNTTLRITPDAAYGFTYSPYGEMLSSTKDGEKTTYAYDHTKRRVIKSGSGLLEHHVIDGYEVEYESGAIVANYE
jgi:YD repeat-containing protein